jgi:hypothetical protein
MRVVRGRFFRLRKLSGRIYRDLQNLRASSRFVLPKRRRPFARESDAGKPLHMLPNPPMQRVALILGGAPSFL